MPALRIADEHMHAVVNELLMTGRGLDFYTPTFMSRTPKTVNNQALNSPIQDVTDWALTSEDYPDDST